MIESKRKIRANDALTILMKSGKCVFFTLTTPDEVDYNTIRQRWRELRHELLRALRAKDESKVDYIMNFEVHPSYLQKEVRLRDGSLSIRRSDGHSHGWHIHGVINRFIPVKSFRLLCYNCGFGRINLKRVNSAGVSEYLTKHALKAYRGYSRKERARLGVGRLRLVNTSRGLPALNSYLAISDFLASTRRIFKCAAQYEKDEFGIVRCPLQLWKLSQVAYLLGLNDLRYLRSKLDGIRAARSYSNSRLNYIL